MELASERFRRAVSKIFETDSDIVATVHVFAHPFTDALKRRGDVERTRVTRTSRDALPLQLAERLSG